MKDEKGSAALQRLVESFQPGLGMGSMSDWEILPVAWFSSTRVISIQS